MKKIKIIMPGIILATVFVGCPRGGLMTFDITSGIM
ncbi:MAG: hypothetical protein ACJAUR_000150 [Ulvibacter sp.]|jgi:hypothetical protein|tara:strand:- start:1670 stop:1777 length:108 start_codon:yes stop_codon:yes gene_type:complete